MSVLSIVSLAASALGVLLYALSFEYAGLLPVFVMVAVVSAVLPPIAKKVRGGSGKKGKAAEIIAIVIGGFNFYCVIFALTKLPVFIGYLGWVACGRAYKCVKIKKG